MAAKTYQETGLLSKEAFIQRYILAVEGSSSESNVNLDVAVPHAIQAYNYIQKAAKSSDDYDIAKMVKE